MSLLDLRLLLKHIPAMGNMRVTDPANFRLDLDLWFMVRWAHTEERFGAHEVAA